MAYSEQAYDSPSSKDVTEVEYATEWYSSSEWPGRQSLSQATKKRYSDQVEADMAEMSSMSKSEINAVMEVHWRSKLEKNRKTSQNSWSTAAICKVIWHSISVADPI
jgi:hypothetical protein